MAPSSELELEYHEQGNDTQIIETFRYSGELASRLFLLIINPDVRVTAIRLKGRKARLMWSYTEKLP